MPKELPSPKLLRKLLRYEPDTGKLFWLERPDSMFKSLRHSKTWNTKFLGREAFTATNSHGYRHGELLGRFVRAHRVAWAIETGAWPIEQIDHINGKPSDNRFSNLRQVSNVMNARNKKLSSNNKSGFIGVSWMKGVNKWQAYITVDGDRHHIGLFECAEQAATARKKADIDFGFHENHGRQR